MDICPLLVGGGESERVTGYSGGGVLIKCRYERRYTLNPKYLCTGPWPCMTKPIWTDAKNEWINSGRFSLFDDTRAAQFWVMIRELTVEDSGTYQCGVHKYLVIDVYTPVELKVEEDLSYKKNISVTGHVGGSVNISCKYPQSHSSDPKFLCRRVGTADCSYETSVKESRRWRNEGKLYLHDDGKQVFTVVINRLTEGDSGEYWCGAESDWTSDHGYKVFITQINLRVTEPTTPPSSSTSRSRSTPQSTKRASSTASTTTMRSSFKSSTAADILPQKGSQTTKTTVSSTFEPTLSQFSAIGINTSHPVHTFTYGHFGHFRMVRLLFVIVFYGSVSPPPAFPVSSVVTGVPVILLLLLIGLLFFIVTLRKRNKTRASNQSQLLKGSPNDQKVPLPVYEEIKDNRHLAASDTGVFTVYSTAQLPTNPSYPPQTDYDNIHLPPNPSELSKTVYDNVRLRESCDFSQTVYSTAQSPSNSPDQNIYSTAQLPTIVSDSSSSASQH
uniref:Immunoglobulin domain-containing protein n=1 Tax=Pygocentrus nattereri TaxID=42514 RepID=A0AAR2ISG8_PYGNA